jgi:hypothetical protein
MILTIAAAALAAQLGSAAPSQSGLLSPVQYCGNGYDLDIRGRCYPNGVIPPQYQAARRYRAYGGPVPCGHGADVDIRDGQCYPNGTVPRRYQQGRQYEYDYYDRPRRRYY